MVRKLKRTVKRSKSAVNRFLSEIENQQLQFWVRNGRVIKSLSELPTALGEMDLETFSFHVNAEKNDFSNWISDVIGDSKLAKQIRNAKDKDEFAKLVDARVTQLQKK